jgi:xylose isomerase
MTNNYAAILGNLGNTCDRFLSSGYKDQHTKAEMFRQAAAIPDVTGIELVGTWDVTTGNVKEIKQLLSDHQLKCVSIIPDHFSQKKWGQGAFTSRQPVIRKEAIQHTCEMVDVAVELQCSIVNIWPGQDGYDYPFQGNFIQSHEWLVEGLRQCADYRPEIQIALEYKMKEPRTHSYLARASDTLLLAKDIDRENVGVTIDFGHALLAYENVAESAAMLARSGKLFHMHFNDNYRYWDDDMIVGSIHTIEYLELLLWLRKLNYQGWFSMDLYPYREDAAQAIAESIRWLKALEERMEKYGYEKIETLIAEGSATHTVREMRKLLLD